MRLLLQASTLLGVCWCAACASQATKPPEYPPMEAPPAVATPEEPATPPAPEAPPPPVVQVVAAESSPLQAPTPTLALRAPRNGQMIRGDAVEVKLDLRNWPLSADGDHVHLIVDDEPYFALRDLGAPIELRALVLKELGHDLAEGTHLLRAFPSRAHHESVKSAGAFDLVTFHFKKKSQDKPLDLAAPLLTYSRPKGCVALGARVLLDFYVSGTTLGARHRVRYAIDADVTGELSAWTPHFIEGLPEGEHTLRLWLVDGQGVAVPGAFHDTTRTIRVASDCAAPPATAPTSP